MKKIITLLLTIAMIFALCACGKAEEPAHVEEQSSGENTSMVGMASPMVEYESLKALNEHYGFKLAHPGVMGVSDESFNAIVSESLELAQYKFTVAGTEYCYRAAATTDDISGIHVEGGTLFSDAEGEATAEKDGFYGSRWFTLDGQYCLTAAAENLEFDTFLACADELKALTETSNSQNPAYTELVGQYQDSWSQRATAEVSAEGEGVYVMVSWANSATECEEWTLPCKFGEDGLLYYTNGVHEKVNYDDNSKETIAADLEGFFGVDENMNLCWNGASEEGCTECVFEKIPE